MNLIWAPDKSPVPTAVAYQVSRKLVDLTTTPTVNPTGTPTPISTVLQTAMPAVGTPVYQDFQVTNGLNYLYQVWTVDSTGALSPPAAVLAAPFLAPIAIQPVTVQDIHDDALDLSWGIPSSSYPVSYYQIYRYAYLTCTITETPTITNSPTPTASATDTPTDSPTDTVTDTPTDSPTGTLTPIPTGTPTNSPTPTPSNTATVTPTVTPSSTSTFTWTVTATFPTTPPPFSVIATAAVPIATVTMNSYSDATASASAALAYYYLVYAVDDQGNSGSQPTTTSNPGLPAPSKAPGPPVLSAAVSTGAYGVDLFWSGNIAAEGVTAFEIQRDGAPLTLIPMAVFTPTVTYLDSTIPATGFPVTYQVQAKNAYGTTGSNSVQESLTAAGGVVLQVTPVATMNAVTLTWSPATPGTYGLSGYQLFKSLFGPPNPNATPLPPGTATVTPTPFAAVTFASAVTFTETPYVDSPIANHASYWVQPVDGVGHAEPPSATTPSVLNLAPTPPANVAAANPVGNNQVAVSWIAGSAGFFGTPVDYVVYRLLLSPTPTPQAVATVVFVPATSPTQVVSYTDIVAGSSGTTIGYQVGLVDSAGNISDLAASGNNVVLTGLSTVPASPAVLPFTGSVSLILFSWLNNPAADAVTSYAVFGITGTPTATVTGTPTTLPTATPLAIVLATQIPTATLVFQPSPVPWSPSYYQLLAQNSDGSSVPATLSGIPVPTYTVTAVIPPGTRQPQVSWNMSPPADNQTPGIDSFGIYRSLSPATNLTPVATVPFGTNTYSDISLTATPGVNYYYRVTARAGFTMNRGAESPLVPTPDTYAGVLTWPNPPSGFSALSGVTQTTLYWAGNNPQENVSSYSVYLNGNATPIATVLPPTYMFAATETPGTQSSYDVVANNVAGPSDASQSATVLVPPSMTPVIALSPPPSPTYVPAATLTPGVWITGFTFSNAVSGYSIYRQSAPTPEGINTPAASPTFSVVGSVAYSTPVFEDANPMPGYMNDYQVVANNGAGVTAVPTISAPLTVTLWPSAPNPQLLPSNTAVTLAWGTPVGNNVPVTSFDIYRSVYPSMTPTAIATNIPYPTPAYIDSNVTTGNPYVYWMDAQDASGGSGLGAPQTIIPLAAPTLYLTPMPEKNQLYWVPTYVPTTSPVTGYQAFRAAITPGATPTFVSVGSIVEPISNTTTVDSSGVNDDVTYLYEIAPSTSNGILSAFSNPVSVTVFPQAVTNLLAVSGDGYVQLRWGSQGVGTNTYFITRRLGTAPGSAAQTIKSGISSSLDNFNDSGIVDKNFYVYDMYTVDAEGLTSNAAAVTALPAAGPVLPQVQIQTSNGPVQGAPVTLTQNANSNQTLIGNTLSWGGADQQGVFSPQTMYPLGGYEIYRSSGGGSAYQSIATLPVTWANGYPAPAASYFDQVELIGGTTYTYLVQAFDAPPDLPVPLSQAITEELVHEADYVPITAYPISPNTALDRNAIRPYGAPNEQIVNIRFVVPSAGNVDIKVYTLSGQYIKELVNQYYPQEGIYWTKWDATNMNGHMVASGVYLVTTESPGGHQEFEKVAVIK